MPKSPSRFLLFAEIAIGAGVLLLGLAFYLWGMDALFDSPSHQHRKLAIEAVAARDYGAAVAEYQKAAELDPDDATIFYELGLVYNQLGRTEDAIRAWSQSLRIDSTMSESAWAIKELSALQRSPSPNTSANDKDRQPRGSVDAVQSLSLDSLR